MAYRGTGGMGGNEDDHRLRDLPRSNVRPHVSCTIIACIGLISGLAISPAS